MLQKELKLVRNPVNIPDLFSVGRNRSFFVAKDMTIIQARKILGKEAREVSDEQLEKDIQTAILFKDLFFDNLIEQKRPTQTSPNVP